MLLKSTEGKRVEWPPKEDEIKEDHQQSLESPKSPNQNSNGASDELAKRGFAVPVEAGSHKGNVHRVKFLNALTVRSHTVLVIV